MNGYEYVPQLGIQLPMPHMCQWDHHHMLHFAGPVTYFCGHCHMTMTSYHIIIARRYREKQGQEDTVFSLEIEIIVSHCCSLKTLHWRHNERNGVSNHQPHECLLNRLFLSRSKETSTLRVIGLCWEITGDRLFLAQVTSNAEMFPFDDFIMNCDRGWLSCFPVIDMLIPEMPNQSNSTVSYGIIIYTCLCPT